MGSIRLCRVYDEDVADARPPRCLVERLWPRGVRKDTLLVSSRDREHNNAVALRDYLREHLRS